MKILFLDIDGVLNSDEWFRANADHLEDGTLEPHRDLDREAVERLNQIIKATDARIVISSTWRKFYSFLGLRDVLSANGFRYPLNIIDTTPHRPSYYRGQEIGLWLHESRFQNVLATDSVENFVILDDCTDLDPFLNELVQTQWEGGLQDEHVAEVIRRLTT